jgi:sensor histidine kinase YesM
VALVPVAHLALACMAYLMQAWLTVAIGHRTGHVRAETGFGTMALRAVSDLALYDLIIYGSILAVIFGLDYAKRYRDRDLIASQLEAQLAQARFSAVQMQLQPHFLFNALNSVAMLVRADRTRDALDVIVGFSELLRYVLDEAGTTDVPLREELRFAKQYLDIETVRYGERLEVTIDAPSELDDALVPNLVLQPLVENAIKHGVSARASGGRVVVRATRRGNQLVLSVRNDGPPLPAGWSLDDTDGVGLRNVRDRLQASADATASFAIGNTADGAGVEATITLPYRKRQRVVTSAHDAEPAAVRAG